MTTSGRAAKVLFAAGKIEPARGGNRGGYRFPPGSAHPCWRGGRTTLNGYTYIMQRGHPRAGRDGYVREHILVAEAALGRFLPPGVEVHHFDGDKKHNARPNLVICQDHAYHMLLEMRQRALRESGHPNWRRCVICHQYDAPENMRTAKGRRDFRHAACTARQAREHRASLRRPEARR